VILPVVRVAEGATLPARAYDGDAGLDLCAAHDARVEPGERVQVGTGVAVAIPPGHAGLVLPRSGLAARHGVALVNAPGLIDAGYRGEIRVLLLNTDRREAFEVHAGDRIAQLLIVAVASVTVTAVDMLGDSERGARGFGSSG
jgi:dUTP pyrophosphatase